MMSTSKKIIQIQEAFLYKVTEEVESSSGPSPPARQELIATSDVNKESANPPTSFSRKLSKTLSSTSSTTLRLNTNVENDRTTVQDNLSRTLEPRDAANNKENNPSTQLSIHDMLGNDETDSQAIATNDMNEFPSVLKGLGIQPVSTGIRGSMAPSTPNIDGKALSTNPLVVPHKDEVKLPEQNTTSAVTTNRWDEIMLPGTNYLLETICVLNSPVVRGDGGQKLLRTTSSAAGTRNIKDEIATTGVKEKRRKRRNRPGSLKLIKALEDDGTAVQDHLTSDKGGNTPIFLSIYEIAPVLKDQDTQPLSTVTTGAMTSSDPNIEGKANTLPKISHVVRGVDGIKLGGIKSTATVTTNRNSRNSTNNLQAEAPPFPENGNHHEKGPQKSLICEVHGRKVCKHGKEETVRAHVGHSDTWPCRRTAASNNRDDKSEGQTRKERAYQRWYQRHRHVMQLKDKNMCTDEIIV